MDVQLIPSVDPRAAVWRAGAHFKMPRLSAPRWVLFVPLFLPVAPTSSPSSSYFCQFFYLYFYLSFFLVALTSPDWSFFPRQCSSKQMSQAGLTLLHRHPASPLLSSPLSLQPEPADCIAQKGGEQE